MSRQLKLRFAKIPEESKQIIEWLNANNKNEFDPKILAYPTLQIMCSYSYEDGPVAYLPQQTVTMLESAAVKPELSYLESAQAFRDFVKGAILLSSGKQIKEIYFLATDEALMKIAEHNGFEKLPWPVMRMKI